MNMLCCNNKLSFNFSDAFFSTFIRYFASLGDNVLIGCGQDAYGGELVPWNVIL